MKRNSGWFWLLGGSGILLYVGIVIVPMVHSHCAGKETVAVVTNTSTRMEGGVGMNSSHQVQYYTLNFDGHSVRKRTSGKHQIGDRLPVIYLTGKPDSVVRGSRTDGLWHTIQHSTNERNLAIAIGVAIVLLLCAAKEFRKKAA